MGCLRFWKVLAPQVVVLVLALAIMVKHSRSLMAGDLADQQKPAVGMQEM